MVSDGAMVAVVVLGSMPTSASLELTNKIWYEVVQYQLEIHLPFSLPCQVQHSNLKFCILVDKNGLLDLLATTLRLSECYLG